ncbi:MAG: hypothetical protein HC849_07180 [Oscillatoriales cyanobacterium RU_3_3]|nr:hypothetical protein [Oscillatoriales cyanobacterium RU_3_3]NJR24378.1 hypothetical protein [Richelia sp. CSU_2_1]
MLVEKFAAIDRRTKNPIDRSQPRTIERKTVCLPSLLLSARITPISSKIFQTR